MSSSSFGALDMGGASMQIAFEQNPPAASHNFSVNLFGKKWDLYSRSYLCFGVNEAYRRSLAYLAMVCESLYYTNLYKKIMAFNANVQTEATVTAVKQHFTVANVMVYLYRVISHYNL